MFKANLKRYRKANNLTKTELAKKTNLSHKTIQYLENGKLNNPTLATLRALAKTLNVTIEELIK